MSAGEAPAGSPPRRPAQKAGNGADADPQPSGNDRGRAANDYGANTRLMREMGSPDYNPMPPDQHRWPLREKDPLMRLWAWMCAHTIERGHRSAYAVDSKKKEVHLEHFAADFDMDPANARHAWEQGVVRGLWRRGNKQEGERRLYLKGKVEPLDGYGEEKEKLKVCTDLLPPYILKQIKKLPPEKQEEYWLGREADLNLKKRVHADLTAVVRLIMDTREDNRLQTLGIKKRRIQETKKKKKDRESGRPEKLTWLQPKIEEFVQTFEASFVQTPETALHKPGNGDVQTSPSLLSFSEVSEIQREEVSVSQSVSTTTEEGPTDRQAPPPPPKQSDWKAQLLLLLDRLIIDLHETPTDRLLKSIHAKLAGAPLEHLAVLIKKRRHVITSLGMVENLADEVGQAWKRGEALRRRETEADARHEREEARRLKQQAEQTRRDEEGLARAQEIFKAMPASEKTRRRREKLQELKKQYRAANLWTGAQINAAVDEGIVRDLANEAGYSEKAKAADA